MRLLYAKPDGNFDLIERIGADIPPYAILSHTWGPDEEEVTYRDIVDGAGQDKPGYRKLTFCFKRATHDGLSYFWVDTCCIDKSSSAELQEAINCFFRWYQNSERCYALMPDVHCAANNGSESGEGWMPAFTRSKWFTRGWTLQELIAPNSVEFFSSDEIWLGNKRSLEGVLHIITRIAVPALRGGPLNQFPIDTRMQWARERQTKREEDAAYCLLGILGVHMPLLYGEGRQSAFHRMRKEVEAAHLASASQNEFFTRDLLSQMRADQVSSYLPSTNITQSHAVGQQTNRFDASAVADEKYKKMTELLAFEQRDARMFTLRTAQNKTCGWILTNTHYKAWVDDRKQDQAFFWIKGKPGAGKSILMKFLVIQSRHSMADCLVLSFFFNARGGALEKSTMGLYRAMLLQLLEKAPEARKIVDDLEPGYFENMKSNDYRWTREALQELITSALQILKEHLVVCYVDALDECPEDDIRNMVSFFEELAELEDSAVFRVCFASRHYPEISIRTGLQLVLEAELDHTRDITAYVDKELRIGNSTQAEDIRIEIVRKSSGVFLWVSLVIPILNKEFDRGREKALKKRLADIPAELGTLFLDLLSRDQTNREDLKICIIAVLLAGRPLTASELLVIIETSCEDAYAFEPYEPAQLTTEALRKFVLDVSKGLAEITTDRRVQFIHESVKDFLLREEGAKKIMSDTEDFEAHGHEVLRRVCSQHVNPPLDRGKIRPQELKKYPLLQYAVQHLFYHAARAHEGQSHA